MPKNDNEKNGEGLTIIPRVKKKLADYIWGKGDVVNEPWDTRAWKARIDQGPGFWEAEVGISKKKEKK